MAHMDIKPENIMVDKNMDPIIIDFGLCGTSHPKNGTTAYHAPEQVVWKDKDPAPFNPLKFDSIMECAISDTTSTLLYLINR